MFGDGSGKDTIFGKTTFNDEKGGLKLKFDSAGIVAMANSGKNSNSCQFFITFAPQPKLDGQYVIFGRVREGMDVIVALEKVGTKGGIPSQSVRITDCGLL